MSEPDQSLLDPEDWEAYRRTAHEALDIALDFARHRPEEPVWQQLPDAARSLDDPLPEQASPLARVVDEVAARVLPHTLGNTHPRFWGWVHGCGSPGGIVAQLLTGAINANMGGRDHAPIYIERQVIRWMCQLYGYPATASGILCTGTSSATLLGLAVARHRALGAASRAAGSDGAPLIAYCSDQAHVSVAKAMEVLGLGSRALRAVPVREDYSMDCGALAKMLQEDRSRGLRPFAVVSSVGTVNTGAIDDIESINALCASHGLWHHADGAFGASIVLSDDLRHRLAGLECADSIAFDFHKWMHVTYATACLLVRDGGEHLATFETAHAYLRGERKGVAAGAPWPNDFGLDLSRGFAALGIWMQLKEHGTARLGAAIKRNCEQATWLGEQIHAATDLELLAPVSLNVVCFRYDPGPLPPEQLDRLNRHLVVELQCRGIAVPSFTRLRGRTAIRVCITNHRTRLSDLAALLDAVPALGQEFLCAGEEPADFDIDR